MRTPEEGHTVRCLASAMIAAIENRRDELIDATTHRFYPITPVQADFDFRIWSQDNGAMHDADGYLADGTMSCTCPEVT